MTPLTAIHELGQSYWMDNLTRELLRSGELRRRVTEEGLRGVTSNPEIFHSAIVNGAEYEAQIEEATTAGLDTEQIYERLVIADVQEACDVLRGVYDASGGEDGFVSLELSPHLAHDAQASLENAVRLNRAVARPNCFIKIPGTVAGLYAIEEALFEGVNVNITLLFSVERYQQVAEAYLRALERRLSSDRPIDGVRSVASFFLSRIDTLVDQLLQHRIRPQPSVRVEPRPEQLLGRVAVANAKLAYRDYQQIVSSERWLTLERRGARRQRLLWASTSTKDPAYSDVMYVEPLIGPDTISTMPERTIQAFMDHGVVRRTVTEGVDAARAVIRALGQQGIDFELVTSQLENEGLQKFIQPYDGLLANIEQKRQRHLRHLSVPRLRTLGQKLRADVIRMTTQAGSGHPTSCMSCADLVAALFFQQMRWDPADPKARNVDQFVLSKGHAAPILWAVLSEAGALSEDPMTLRQIDSTLEGHPTPRNPWVRVATGSLGQGLSAANGIALANRLDGLCPKVYCLLGDAECSEGSVWEAAQFASLHALGAVVALVDVNALGQSAATPYGYQVEVLERRFAAFGWRTRIIDGHDMTQITEALFDAGQEAARPMAILAKTVKGKGVSFLAGKNGWHGKTLNEEQKQRALAELGDVAIQLSVRPRHVGEYKPRMAAGPKSSLLELDYRKGDKFATRHAHGRALEKLGERHPELVVLDGDVKDSTGTALFARRYPGRFFEGYIAEQNLAGVALGLASCGKTALCATFAAFLSRAYDFIRMAGHTRPEHLLFVGSHAGVSIGQDGPSQMGLEDIAMFRALGQSTVLYPCDAVSAERLTELALGTQGIVYLRTTRAETPILYGNDEQFVVGGSKVLRRSERDQLTIVSAGITVYEALAACDLLGQRGVSVRVIDAYSVKPIDAATLREAAQETGQIIVVEDHWPEGGIGDAVCAALDTAVPVRRLAVRHEPRSGPPSALLDLCGISRSAIVEAVEAALRDPRAR